MKTPKVRTVGFNFNLAGKIPRRVPLRFLVQPGQRLRFPPKTSSFIFKIPESSFFFLVSLLLFTYRPSGWIHFPTLKSLETSCHHCFLAMN